MSKNTNLSFLTDYITADITNGRIGINNASPTVAFDVVGATKITGVLTLTSTISNGTYAYTLPSATGTLALTSALSGTTNYVAKFTSSTAIGNSLIYDDGTNVGIGTASPTFKLDVNGTARVKGVFSIERTINSQISTLSNEGGNFTISANSTYNTIFQEGTTERMRITSAGNVGIGTSSPDTYGLFVVNGSSSASGISAVIRNSFDGSDSTKYSGIDFMMGSDNGTASIRAFRTNSAVDYQTALTFLTKGTGSVPTSPTERMRITSAGNVGIGTSSPARMLSLYNGTIGLYSASTGQTSTDGYTMELSGTTAYLWNYENDALIFGTNNSERGRSTAGGNWLLGTTSDNGERLYVSGSIRATGSITANSDINLKKNLLKIENALEKVEQINGYTYEFKENDSKRHAGLIAQEVEIVLPEIVNAGADKIKGIEYGNISALLVEAIKELSTEINIIKKQINL